MQIEVINVTVNTMPTAKGSYQVAEVAYKDLKDGKVNGKKIMSFAAKEAFKVLSTAKAGDKFDVGLEKDDKGYWQWKSATPSTGAASAPSNSSGHPAPRSNYETPEERNKRQDYIIRQSSVSSAIALLKTDKKSPSVNEVLTVAEQFVKFVYSAEIPFDPSNPMEGMQDDIPM